MFQPEFPTGALAINPVVLYVIGLVLTLSIPIVGWAFRSIHKRVDDVKADLDAKITKTENDAESKRLETRDTLLELVEAKFDAIWNTLKDIKDEVKHGHN